MKLPKRHLNAYLLWLSLTTELLLVFCLKVPVTATPASEPLDQTVQMSVKSKQGSQPTTPATDISPTPRVPSAPIAAPETIPSISTIPSTSTIPSASIASPRTTPSAPVVQIAPIALPETIPSTPALQTAPIATSAPSTTPLSPGEVRILLPATQTVLDV